MGTLMPAPLRFTKISTEFQKPLDNGSPFPLVLSPDEDSPTDVESLITALQLRRQKEWLEGELENAGAILLRGFELVSPEDFNSVVEALGWENFPYFEAGGNAPRKQVYGRVLTANDGIPFHLYIGYHNEAAYVPESPARVIFFCHEPPKAGAGGATPIVPGHVVYKRVLEKPHLVDELMNKGPVVLTKVFPEDGPGSWKEIFKTEDKHSVEAKVEKSPLNRFQWLADGELVIFTPPLSPLFKEDRAGRMSIFTSLGSLLELNKSAPTKVNVQFGDGSQLQVTGETAQELVNIMREEEVSFPWKKGDILLIDNSAVLHSREICSDSNRRILVAVTK